MLIIIIIIILLLLLLFLFFVPTSTKPVGVNIKVLSIVIIIIYFSFFKDLKKILEYCGSCHYSGQSSLMKESWSNTLWNHCTRIDRC